ncbi:MAG TPA: aquaporin [Pseudonocardiaceae bacterium]|jgi:aquaporin Z
MAGITTVEGRAVPAAPAQARAVGRKYVVEAIGTFFLVFTVAACGLSGSTFTPLAAGAVLMVMIYAGGHISGGHYNPAVTMAVLCRGRIGFGEAIGYWVAQLIAGVAAAAVARALIAPATVRTLTLSGHALTVAMLAEALFTFALCYVVLNVATSKDQQDNQFFGLAIGFTVAAGAFAVGGLSGAAFNPAVALGAAVGGLFAWQTVWVYVLVQAVAGVLAGLVFRLLNPNDR